MNTTWSLPDRPLSIEEITSEANNFKYSNNVPFKHWLRAADSLHRQGKAYVRDGNLAQAYLLLYRFSTLVIKYIPTHPEAKDPEGKNTLKALRARTKPVLETLSELNPQLKAAYDEWVKIHETQQDASTHLDGEKSSFAKRASKDPALSWNPRVRAKLLDADDNQELAVDLANREIRRRDAARKATRQAGISEEEEQQRRTAGLWDNWDAPATRKRSVDDGDIRLNMDAVRRRLDQADQARQPPSPDGIRSQSSTSNFYDRAPSERYTFRPAAYLENGTPLRSIFLPTGLRDEFLRLAGPNTRKGLEMCGILCGTAVNNALFISCLVIPQQTCTSDTCETDNEEAVMEFCMQEDLMVFGWIHTHPTQSCFMSSRDMHTQSGYQVMMPESIAIVCAPRSEPSFGIFRLTNPPGLDHILRCTQSATFHPHSLDNLYTDAVHPTGHVYHSSQMDFTVEDLRTKSRK
ncbi:hypothetical protein M406DRAFT_49060 [Cryphonectria parasitica EP155]|uniref:MPN domain-containing protein n=1 Tax=Cryphonectria parasitica (strain ATCC 38755 / EP155) TaxID=660469 RepID=A0A9P4XXZ6_CRYP1|nr:uncharacterized protein M406DRAFT_49060 [Cryphonectria parasitica EP155]KAF3763359.1 hypothetical protein M406DRAFT_49060 [Cryphonectria parasitica EP155]